MKYDSSSDSGSKRRNWSAISNLENSIPKEEILMELQEEGKSYENQEDPIETTFHGLLDIPLKLYDLCEDKEEGIIEKVKDVKS